MREAERPSDENGINNDLNKKDGSSSSSSTDQSAFADTLPSEARSDKLFNSGAIRPTGDTKRFYKTVSVRPSENQWAIELDSRTIVTPKGEKLIVPSIQLAYTIAGEWEAQREYIQPKNMPMMVVTTTGIDRLITGRSHVRQDLIFQFLEFLASDALSILDPEHTDLGRGQKKVWEPIVKWFTQEFHVPFRVTTTIAGDKTQDPDTANAIELVLHQCSDWELVGLDGIVNNTKSLILGLAVLKGHLPPAEALAASLVDENYQMARYGKVTGIHDVQYVELLKTTCAAALLFRLLPPEYKKIGV